MERIAASPHLFLMCVLGPLFFMSSLYQLVLTRSRCPQLPKANHFLAYLALLAGPEALSHPVTAQKSLGRGCPPQRPPPRRRAAPWLGYAQPAKPKKKLRLRRKIEGNRSPRRTAKPKKKLRLRWKIDGNRSPRRTALKIPQKVPCPNSLPL
jgi:hypothetical protein